MKHKKGRSLIRERNWRNKWKIDETSWACVKCEWGLFLCPESKTLQSTNYQSCIKSWCQQISHVGPVTQELFPHPTVKYDNVAEAANTHSQTKNRREVWLLLRKTSWNASASIADLSTAETWGQSMEIPTMWTFDCFQMQLTLKRNCLTSSPLTNASLLREFYPLLVCSSLLYIINWQTTCSVFSATDHSVYFFSQSFTGLCCTILRQLDPVLQHRRQWSWPNQYGSDADSVLRIICAQNKVRHARLETLLLMKTVVQMAPRVAATNNSSVQTMPKFKELWDSFWKGIIYSYGLNEMSSTQFTGLIIHLSFLSHQGDNRFHKENLPGRTENPCGLQICRTGLMIWWLVTDCYILCCIPQCGFWLWNKCSIYCWKRACVRRAFSVVIQTHCPYTSTAPLQ